VTGVARRNVIGRFSDGYWRSATALYGSNQ